MFFEVDNSKDKFVDGVQAFASKKVELFGLGGIGRASDGKSGRSKVKGYNYAYSSDSCSDGRRGLSGLNAVLRESLRLRKSSVGR